MALIKKFLGDPDATKANPHYRSAAPMRLYCRRRVERKERSKGFIEAQTASRIRSQASRNSAEKRKQALIAELEKVPIHIRRLPIEQVRKAAIDSFNQNNNFHRHPGPSACEDSEPAFLERIIVNHIRHNLTEYDETMDSVSSRVGADAARDLIADRVFEAIAEAYPELEEECCRQQDRRMHEWLTML